MSRIRASLVGALAASLLAVGLNIGVAAAAGPEIETVTISETFYDDFLSAACGVDVTTTATGRVTLRTFDGGEVGPASVNTLNIALEARAGDNVVRFRDVGADVLLVGPDGSVTLMIIGQIPFGFTGVLKIDLLTGDAVLEPTHLLDTTEACATLTA
ncbi:MAG TPA: hypothetical protein VLS28_10450 [Candidatus Sulfomarinibacteraceae bacterium]|nr:hypothetical protein [Candidatus Sulfomarinibacteraceae bacterium]